ncbi:MAG: hypothetical protein QOI78_5587 [Actinomycetota bacterium]|nr:hypothetical protein [Actinomycetota bacterium]
MTEPSSKRLQISRSHGEPVVLAAQGELDEGTTLTVVRAVAAALASVPPPQVIVLDLSGLRALSLTGVRVVLAVVDHAAADAVHVRVVTGGPVAGPVLRAIGVDRVLDVYPTRSAALHAGDRAEFLRLTTLLWNA